MELQSANHPKNKPVLFFSSKEVEACATMTHTEARRFLARTAFLSDLPSFSHPVLCEPEYLRVRAGQLDPTNAVIDAIRERDSVREVLARYGATITILPEE